MDIENVSLIDEIYLDYKRNPTSVNSSWYNFFRSMEIGSMINSSSNASKTKKSIAHIIDMYRHYGHMYASFNSLQQKSQSLTTTVIKNFNLSDNDLNCKYQEENFENLTLKTILQTLESIYCQNIGIEYCHISDERVKSWIRNKIEPQGIKVVVSSDERRQIALQMLRATVFEEFLQKKFPTQKRFSLEGSEVLLPMLYKVVDLCAKVEISSLIMGMAHRGRLNVLYNFLNNPYILGEFDDENLQNCGDVKYHKGYASVVNVANKNQVKVFLMANPSHLEAVNPVVEGFARGKADVDGKANLPLLIHGDAALAGQGIIYETLQHSKIKGYETGGTIHLVINNHIGFTASPEESRSSSYCTDIAKAFDFPVFHVNAECLEDCISSIELAVKIRQKFHCDVFIDINGYRKRGHNESDNPEFTNPLYCQKVLEKNDNVYKKNWAKDWGIDDIFFKQNAELIVKELEFSLLKKNTCNVKGKIWQRQKMQSGVSKIVLQDITRELTEFPKDFIVHPKVGKIWRNRKNAICDSSKKEKVVDWSSAEFLALASLIKDGFSIRFAGQDCCRGTFSQRHFVLIDQKFENKHCIFNDKKGKSCVEIINSPLSEYGSLGFEFGYSIAVDEENFLVIWEAQFGDFANGAQIIIDQFIASSIKKWNVKSRLVLMLPHGYEGQGPEHSSARIERFCQLAAENNLTITQPTIPSQLFHLLRNQAIDKSLPPLVIFTPKSLLRSKLCLSSLEEFSRQKFSPIVKNGNTKDPRCIIMCSGKLYHQLRENDFLMKESLMMSLEQLFPFPEKELIKIFKKYKKAKYMWVQEEPQNMGAWNFIYGKFKEIAHGGVKINFLGREGSASTSTGSVSLHDEEQKEIFHKLLQTVRNTI